MKKETVCNQDSTSGQKMLGVKYSEGSVGSCLGKVIKSDVCSAK